MAWDVVYHNVNNGGLIWETKNFVVNCNWGEYNVYVARFSSSVTEVMFDMDYTNIQGIRGNPVVFVCRQDSDFNGTEENPTYYESFFYMDSPVIIDVSSQTTWYIVVRPNNSNSSGIARMYLRMSGGSGSIEPTFSAEPVNNTDIHIHVSDIDSINYDSFYYVAEAIGLTPYSATSLSNDHTFDNVPDGTYSVKAYYEYNGTRYSLYTVSGSDTDSVTINRSGGGGGSSETWTYTQVSGLYNVSDFGFVTCSLTSGNGQYFGVIFSKAGKATVEVQSDADAEVFFTDGNYSYDQSDGYPYASSSGSKAESGSSRQLDVLPNLTYYVWVKGLNYSTQTNPMVAVRITESSPTPTQWSYAMDSDASHENVNAAFSEWVQLGEAVGSYFGVTFANSGTAVFAFGNSPNAILYVTVGNNSFNQSDGRPFGTHLSGSGGTSVTDTVTAGTTYIVWVRGSTDTVTGGAQVNVTPPSSTPQQWNRNNTSNAQVSTSQVLLMNFPLAAGYVYRTAVTFTQACNARFYSTGGNDRMAWLTESDNGINQSTGIPNGSFLASDADGSGDFDFTYNVAANTTYYFWVRSKIYSDTSQLVVYLDPQAGSGGGGKGKVWIYTGPTSGWKAIG